MIEAQQMAKAILASLTGFGSDKTVMDAAVAVATIEGGHIDCLHTRIDAVETAAWIGAMRPRRHHSLGEIAQSIAQEEQGRSIHAKAAFQDACRRHSLIICDEPGKADGVSVSWKELTTLSNETLHQARFHDLVVLARETELSSERIYNVLEQSGRPVLIAPAKPIERIGRTVVIAWKDGPESGRALSAAMPILSLAENVFIVSVSENDAGDDADRWSAEQLQKQLCWHGIKAEIRLEYSPTVSTSKKIGELAYNCDADLLVMGQFGHSRIREFILGGVTRDILAAFAIPVFMFR